ncbi:MAG: hypothetical protein RLN76_10100 [Phycisphaeraceae bacterium]
MLSLSAGGCSIGTDEEFDIRVLDERLARAIYEDELRRCSSPETLVGLITVNSHWETGHSWFGWGAPGTGLMSVKEVGYELDYFQPVSFEIREITTGDHEAVDLKAVMHCFQSAYAYDEYPYGGRTFAVTPETFVEVYLPNTHLAEYAEMAGTVFLDLPVELSVPALIADRYTADEVGED